ncbi:hypothetical protein V8C42DRAFT_325442 [Trichoderma barbatum]
MGLRQFNQDLAASKATEINGVSKIRRGDSDGEVVFTWSLDDATSSLDIRILVLDVDSYPKSSSVMIFTESEHSMLDVSSVLERLSASLENKNIQTVIKAVAEKLLTKVEASANSGEDYKSDADPDADPDADSDADSDDALDSHDEELGSEYGDYLYDDSFLPDPPKQHTDQISNTSSSSTRLKKDLQIVQSAGISVGVFPRKPLREADFFSLSLRVSKLGIPEHALEAWGLQSHEYVVLLCRFPSHYPPLSKLSSDGWSPQFRFGKCSKPKPSMETARLALKASFDGIPEGQKTSSDGAKDTSGNFVPIFVSNSINMLMNHEFLALLKIRRSDGISWDEAMHILKAHTTGIKVSLQKPTSSNNGTSDTPVSENAISSLGHDYALDQDEDFSLPMTAMQFALRHFARCTKYCMVCHQRLEDEFEALKPYVCSSPLCTYQYVTLGLGASIEHEIVSNPYVVDILVSFFDAALGNPTSLRTYPAGLNIKTVLAGSNDEYAPRIVAEACFYDRAIRFGPDAFEKMNPKIKVGDSVVVVIEGTHDLSVAKILDSTFERHICRVIDVVANYYTFEVIATFTTPRNVLPLPEDERPTELSSTTKEWKKVMIFQYIYDTDGLSDVDRSVALSMVLQGIPSVLDMRAYLLNNPSHRLASWSRLDKNSLTLLQWIISSNRSLIFQDDEVPNLVEPTKETADSQDTVSSNPSKVKGLPPHWMQFRFLQGTPEREHLFMKEIMAVSQSKSEQSRFPTIFAWHGSSLKNWHSIIRTGLDFNIVQNGRAFGNGVYMSNEFSVSLAFSGKRPAGMETRWQNSLLNPSSAISICEVVNRCDQFLKQTPHYVVTQIEWIQCRYLFVAVDPTPQAMQQPFPTKPKETCAGYVSQDPTKLLCATVANVNIPLSALPSNRRHLGQRDGAVEGTEPLEALKTPEGLLDSDHGETDNEFLLDSEEDEIDDVSPPLSKKRRSSSINSADKRSYKLDQASHSMKMSSENTAVRLTTDFLPGRLDLESLPKLPDPSWASTSPVALKTLNRAIKELHGIQRSEELASLGWYIDFDKINNLFHWIVELHSFELDLPLAQDMKNRGCTSVVLEFRFSANFPFSPPFVRVVRPRFLPFARGGGGHVTLGGAICSEMLTNSGWSAAMTIEKVLLQIRLGLVEREPPARLDSQKGINNTGDYSISEAVDAYQRAANAHGWQIPDDLKTVGSAWTVGED